MLKRSEAIFVLVFIVAVLTACAPESDEPERVRASVISNSTGLLKGTTAEGWNVTLETFDACMENFEFTQEGEAHASIFKKISDFLVPVAMAHPGHLSAGDVTGTLDGSRLVSLGGPTHQLGEAILLEGDYNGFNFSFCKADGSLGVSPAEPAFGHHAYLEGTAEKLNTQIRFHAWVDVVGEPTVWGGVFEESLPASFAGRLRLQAHVVDPVEGDCLFDGILFGELDENGDGEVQIEAPSAAHNILMKALTGHDNWSMTKQP